MNAAMIDTIGIALRQGRGFYPHETQAQAPVAVISEATARRLWPGASPLGRSVQIEEGETPGIYRQYEVVGVVADVMSGFFFRGLDASAIYRPGSLASGAASRILLRLDAEDPASASSLKAACAESGVLCDPVTFRKLLAMQRFPFSVASLIASSLGVLALGLACLGLHGLVRFAALQRSREFGVRLALGATRRQILFTVLGESVRRVGRGILVGLPLSLALSALVASQIRIKVFESFDPVSYSAVPLLLLAAAIVASLLPALRAAATDPIKALREE